MLDRGERDKARPGILLCVPLRLKGPRGKVQSATGQWYDVHADMSRRDNIPEGAGQGDQCWRCTKEAGQVPWPVLQMTAWTFLNATMRATDARGQRSGPVLPKEVQEGEEAQGEVEVWWGRGKGGEEHRCPVGMGHSAGTAGRGRWGGSEFPDGGLGEARRGGAHSARGPQVWRECQEDQANGPRVASRQGMVLGSGTGIPGAGQGEG